MTNPGYLALPYQIAVLCIAAAGACLIFQRRAPAARLFFAGFVIAAATGIAANAQGDLAELALWIGAIGLSAAIFGVRRWPVYLVACAVALGVVLPLVEPIARALLAFWWVIPLLLAIACGTSLIAMFSLQRLRERVYAGRPKRPLDRIFPNLLDRMTGFRRRRQNRDRHIGDIGLTRRARQGRGPNSI